MADSGYAEACVNLENDVMRAAARVEGVLTNEEVAAELRRLAKVIESDES